MTLNKQLLLPSFVWLVFSVSLLLLAILKSSVVCSQDTVLNVYSIVSSVVAPSGTVTCNEGQALAGCGYESSCCNQYTYNWAVVPQNTRIPAIVKILSRLHAQQHVFLINYLGLNRSLVLQGINRSVSLALQD